MAWLVVSDSSDSKSNVWLTERRRCDDVECEVATLACQSTRDAVWGDREASGYEDMRA